MSRPGTHTTPALPVLERRAEIEALIRAHRVVVLCGQTGSGKTTQLPQMCLELGLADEGKGRGRGGIIAHTQPRRLAARAVAARIAEERGEPLGGTIGVKVRFFEQTSPRTRVKVMTDGMLLAELTQDRSLRSYSTIIIDEAHERSLNIDFLLGRLRGLIQTRDDLRVIVTSATIDTRRFSDFFGGQSAAPVIEVSGRMFPVEVRYRPTRDDDAPGSAAGIINPETVADAVEDVLRPGEPGDALVFLPGEREIRQCAQALARRRLAGAGGGAGSGGVEVLPLFARLSNAEQDRIFHPQPGTRRVILATNLAETSLTVPGIRYVVDTGVARLNRYDPARKVQRLEVEPISRASADQRAGRCGRVAAGVCVRLYSEASYRARPEFTDPEIRRSSLASVILSMHALELGSIETFPFPEPPAREAIDDGYHTLFEIGAIDAPGPGGRLTPIGRAVATIPVEPRVGRMLLAGLGEGVLDDVTVLAAALSVQDPRERPGERRDAADAAHEVFRDKASDFATLLNIWEQYRHASETMAAGALAGWCRDRFLSPARMREWAEMVWQLGEIVDDLRARERSSDPQQGAEHVVRAQDAASAAARPRIDRVHRALLTGLISNVACREAQEGSFEYRGVRGNVVAIFPGSSLFKASPRWIMAAEIVQTTRLYARTVAKIDPAWVEELAGHMFKRQVSDPHLDAATGRPVAFERVSMSGVVVVPRREVELASVDPATARRVFVLEALARGRWTGAEADDGDNRPTIAALEHNAAVLALVRKAEERVRRRGLVRSDEQLAAWLNARLPETVRDPASLRQWLARDPAGDAHLRWSIDDVIAPTAAPDVRRGLDAAMFPDTLAIGAASMPLSYALAPGKDDDGVSVDVPLAEADRLTTERAAWLVPGLLADLIAAMLKGLSKEQRAALERAAGVRIEDAASGVASVLNFAEGSLPGAISEALSVLYGASVGPEALEKALKGVPDHLRVRVRVLDERGGVAGAGRDIGAVLARLGPRIAAARASVARRAFAQSGLKAWTFGNLPERVEADQGGPGAPESAGGWPAIVDHGTSAGLTLAPSPEHARAWTLRGVRRLYVLACGEELSCLIDALPGLSEMARQYQALGHSAAPGGLKDALACVVAERIFLAGHAEPPRTRDEFEARLEAGRGRLTVASREVGEVAARVLDARGKVAHRLASGTPRLWAASIADIREHATYLLAEGWLTSVGWERLRRYPVYAEAMRERLANLREEGSKAELTALAQFAPHWKRYTAWVAAAMSRERERHADGADAGQEPSGPGSAAGKKKAALPQTRRTGAVVNIDAGAWVMAGGAGGGRGGKGLPPAVEAYRWALEELRVSLFAPGLSGAGKTSVPEVERLWRAVGAAD